MIFDTNRTKSLIDVEEAVETEMEVELNENYFGAGALFFMQESAEDEMMLFEAAVKTDLDEVVIGESANELTALNEGFVENTVKKVEELMTKFIEWLKGITRTAIMKLTQYLARDNAKFCKEARKRIQNVPNDFKYTGKALKSTKFESVEDLDKFFDDMDKLWDKVNVESGTKESAENVKAELAEMREAIQKAKKAKNFDEVNVYQEENGTLKTVEDHLDYLEKTAKDKVKDLNAKCKKYEAKAKAYVKEAKANAKKAKKEDTAVRDQAAVAVAVANEIKKVAQMTIDEEMKAIRKMIAVSRSVVAKALAKVPAAKNEGVEIEEELMEAFIEAEEYELESALEEMSEASECETEEDDEIAEEDK